MKIIHLKKEKYMDSYGNPTRNFHNAIEKYEYAPFIFILLWRIEKSYFLFKKYRTIPFI